MAGTFKIMLTKCKCGNDVFLVHEYLVHKASVDEETGTLEVYKQVDNGTEETVYCSECEREYSINDFKFFSYC